jgi:hypothetical protein
MHFTKPQLTHPDAPSQNAPQPPRLPPTGPHRRRRRRAAGSELHVLRRPRLPLASAEERLLGVPDAHGGPGPRARPTGPRRRLGRRGGGVPAVQEARARAVGAPRAQGGRRVRRRLARRRRGLRQRDGTGRRAGVLLFSVCACLDHRAGCQIVPRFFGLQLELGVDESYTIYVASPGGANSVVGGATIEVRRNSPLLLRRVWFRCDNYAKMNSLDPRFWSFYC